jgi:hypothetical protein
MKLFGAGLVERNNSKEARKASFLRSPSSVVDS